VTGHEIWPPIIRDASVPRLVVWRDRFFTAIMWLVLLWLCRHSLYTLADVLREPSESGRILAGLGLAERWARLSPYFAVIGLFAAWLFLWMLATLRRRRRSAVLPQPTTLTLEEEARKAGCTAADLSEWRQLKVCTAHLDDRGALSIVPGRSA
jgi:poly-beta-1,6-N-acetyl-D-glucosamine biosynthesis protein PgaD